MTAVAPDHALYLPRAGLEVEQEAVVVSVLDAPLGKLTRRMPVAWIKEDGNGTDRIEAFREAWALIRLASATGIAIATVPGSARRSLERLLSVSVRDSRP